ncbi:Kanosamine kinase [Frankia sp. AiPs1]|uniref:ROK family protein n=1 Tax=Frankia sp. AiPa1 TaxID=573492 RepID=UPI00202B3792|nr:ROK family protein [Frankia sp. AiPa1]MCL9759938.1 ROK family protein [Frankia sp. AiPa1]
MPVPVPTPTPGILGIDVGGTKVALRIEPAGTTGPAWADGTEPVEASLRWAPSASAAHDLDDLAAEVTALRARWSGPVSAVGIAMPATVDPNGQVATWPGRPSWTGMAFADAMRTLVPGARVAYADDGDLAALAEADAAGCPDLVYLGIGTGVGGGIVLEGRPCPPLGHGSAEIGHMVIAAGGARCGCGRRGCVQATASGPATLRRAAQYRAEAETRTATWAPGDTVSGDITPAAAVGVEFADLRPAWLDGIDWAVRAVQESALAAAVAVVSLTEVLHPELVVVGGGFADGLPGFAQAVDEQARALGRPGHPPAPVQAARLGGLSSLSGALLLARQTS